MMRQKATIILSCEDTGGEDGIWRVFPRLQVAESSELFMVINIVEHAIPQDAPLIW